MASVLLVVALAGCSLLVDQLGTGPRPEEYFDGADAELAGAVRSRNVARIDEQLRAGANPEATGKDDLTMLQYAVLTSSVTGVEALLKAGADPDRIGAGATALYLAVGDGDLVRTLLAGDADPNIENPGTGATPIFGSCLALGEEGFEELVAAGADLQHKDLLGDLALHTCAGTNQGDFILRMLELGVDPLAPDHLGGTFQETYFRYPPANVLNERAKQQRREIVAWLLGHGYEIVPEAEAYR